MKKLVVMLLMSMSLTVSLGHKVKAEPEIVRCKATAYCPTGRLTATGTVPKEGRTIAGKWLGKTIIAYEDFGNGIEPQAYMGTFICEDIGGKAIQSGAVVDLLIEDYDRAVLFGSKNVILVIVDAEG